MAKIAVAVETALTERRIAGSPGGTTSRTLGDGDGWSAADVICTSGPLDRRFEERHAHYSISIVLTGTFQYRSTGGHELMAPGSLMLGNVGRCFECGHEHGAGDRCIGFWYDQDYFERLAADAGLRRRSGDVFRTVRIPPLRALSPIVTMAEARVLGAAGASWEEIGIRLAASAVQLAAGVSPASGVPASAVAAVARAVRRIDAEPAASATVAGLAREARVSPYHFLRTFERVVGATPHQYLMRSRLRHAAARLLSEDARIIDVVFDAGFGDVSNFNRAFKAAFGASPRAFRGNAKVAKVAKDAEDAENAKDAEDARGL